MLSQFLTNLILATKRICQMQQVGPVLRQLSLAVAYLVMHAHTLIPQAKTKLLDDMLSQLSGSKNEFLSLVLILKNLASECEDEEVVIEETVRESFYDYLDAICISVFSNFFEDWAGKLLTNSLGPEGDLTDIKVNII